MIILLLVIVGFQIDFRIDFQTEFVVRFNLQEF